MTPGHVGVSSTWKPHAARTAYAAGMACMSGPGMRGPGPPARCPAMSHLILSPFSHDARSAARELGVPDDYIQCREQGTVRVLHAHTPYLLASRMEPADWPLLTTLAPWGVAQPLTRLCTTCGGDTTRALAGLIDELHQVTPYALSGVGAAASTFTSRMQRFHSAVGQYHSAMLEYRSAARHPPLDRVRAAVARQRMQQAGEALSRGFATELRESSRHMSLGKRQLLAPDGRTPLTVRRARHIARLDVVSSIEASRLARLARRARPVGPGALAFDFAWRAADVHAEYQAGGDWERKAVVEGTGFAAGAVASTAAVSMGGGLLTLAVAAAPVGWVLIVGGVGVVAMASLAAVHADRIAQDHAQAYYDAHVTPAQRKP